MTEFPADDVLLARGKYSTLSGEKREHLKRLRDDMEAIVSHARLVVRSFDDLHDLDFAVEQSQHARKRIDQALERLGLLNLLTQHMIELKPLAWGKGAPE